MDLSEAKLVVLVAGVVCAIIYIGIGCWYIRLRKGGKGR